jgi:hypothetical protein
MPNKPRSSDGTMRRANRPKVLTNRSIIARWVEAETLHLKRLGMGYQAIADHIVEVAQGRQKAMAPVPQDAQFPEGYQLSMQAVHRAFRRAIVRLPNAEAAELRKLDSERLEEMFLSLQAGIRKGDPRSIEVGVKVLVHKAEMNGYKAPARVDMTGTRVDVLVQQQAAADAQALANLDHLTLEELREYRRLEPKARSAPDVIDGEAMQAREAQSSDKPDGAE